MAGPEFVFLNEQAVRVTAWREDATSGAGTLVAITRGSVDRDRLLELLEATPLRFRLPDAPERVVSARDIDVRSTGAGPQAIYRISATLVPADVDEEPSAASAPSVEERLASIERRLEQIAALVREIRDGRA